MMVVGYGEIIYRASVRTSGVGYEKGNEKNKKKRQAHKKLLNNIQ
jgi:hypothetical protein